LKLEKPKRRKKTERKILDEACLKLWSQIVRTKDKRCRNCGSDYNLQAHHIISRQYKLSRYNSDIGLTLCRGCHFVEKTDPERFRDMVIGIIGEENYLSLKNCYMVQYKWSVPELKEIRDDLKAELKRIQSDWEE